MTIVIIAAGKRFRVAGNCLSRCNPNQSAPVIVASTAEQRREEEKNENVAQGETSRRITFDSHIEPENCAARAKQTRTNFFFFPFAHSPPHFSPYPVPKCILTARLQNENICTDRGRSLFVRDCETRFLRKRREKLQSRFVERFD